MFQLRIVALALLIVSLGLHGCNRHNDKPQAGASASTATEEKVDELAGERAKLSAGDRALVEAQEWCVISTEERLGSMGPPLKLEIKGKPVFICCKGCKRKAEADPDGTLAKVEELRDKAKAERASGK